MCKAEHMPVSREKVGTGAESVCNRAPVSSVGSLSVLHVVLGPVLCLHRKTECSLLWEISVS